MTQWDLGFIFSVRKSPCAAGNLSPLSSLWSGGQFPCAVVCVFLPLDTSLQVQHKASCLGWLLTSNQTAVVLLTSSSALLWAAAYSVATCSSTLFPLSAFPKLYIKYSLLLSCVCLSGSQAAANPPNLLIWYPVQEALKARPWCSWLLPLLSSPLATIHQERHFNDPFASFPFSLRLQRAQEAALSFLCCLNEGKLSACEFLCANSHAVSNAHQAVFRILSIAGFEREKR